MMISNNLTVAIKPIAEKTKGNARIIRAAERNGERIGEIGTGLILYKVLLFLNNIDRKIPSTASTEGFRNISR